MKKIAACAVASFVGSGAVFGWPTHARAAETVAKPWSVLFPDHTAIPEKFVLRALEASLRAFEGHRLLIVGRQKDAERR
jgi:hypothetical protein